MNDFTPHSGIQWNGNVGRVQYGTDQNMIAMFYNKPVHNPQKSQAEGRPVFEDQVFVRIHPPGERLNIVDRPIKAEDKRRFPNQWQQFQENREQIPEGTPIDLLYPEHPSIPMMLRAHNVHTVEQCAQLSGDAIENIGMGAQRYINDAAQYLEMSNRGVKATQFRAELDKRDREIRTLVNQVSMLTTEVQRLTELNQGSTTLKQVERLIAGGQARPQFPKNAKQIDPNFDSQTAMINSTHVTADVARNKTKKRARPRITA